MDSDLLLRQNPWWSNVEAIDEEPRLKILKNMPLVWRPDFIEGINTKEDAVHILTGPRQVGKSTAVRLLIKELLLEKKINPRNILLYNCDILASPKEIVNTVLSFFDTIAPTGRKYVILDEVTAVPNWPNAIKWLIDNGHDKDCLYLLTGSSAINIKKSGEYMPGRRKKGKDIRLLPLCFKDYVKLIHPSLKTIDIKDTGIKDLQSYYNGVRLEFRNLPSLFDNYLLHGGFLKPINEIEQTGAISPETVEIYVSWIKGEVAKAGKREQVAKGILEKISLSLAAGLSYQGLSEYVDLGSHNTARSYLDFFIDSFIVEEVPFIEISQKKTAWRKNRKYYLADPFLIWISSLWTGGGDNIAGVIKQAMEQPARSGVIIENVILNHLKKSGYGPAYGEVRGQEIDFYLEKKDIGIEVKFQRKITPTDVAAVKMLKKGFCVSRDTLAEIDGTIAVPANLFCLCDI